MKETATQEKSSAQETAQALGKVLADTYVLYVKTQNFHWNLVDPRFESLHKFFEGQYEELAEAVDEIAERIRMLNSKTPATMKKFLRNTRLEECEDEDLDGDAMISQLLQDHEFVANSLRPVIQQAQKRGDEGTADLLIQRLRAHEKTAWMLRST